MRLLRSVCALFFFSLLLSEYARADVYLQSAPAKLAWSANPEPDVIGYEIYRSSAYDGAFAKVSSGVVTASWWQDYNLSEGGRYYYKLQATDSYGNKSPLSAASDAVILDSTPPSVNADMAGGTYQETIHVSLIANEKSAIYYTTDGSFPTSASTVYCSPIPISQTTTLRFYAVDLAGNWSSIQTRSYVIDTGGTDIVFLTGPTGTPNPVASGETVRCSAEAGDPAGHTLRYHWSATGGDFDNVSASNPVWTAPANWSEISTFYEIMVSVTCSEGDQVFASFFEEVLPGHNLAPLADAGEDAFARGQAQVALEGCGSYDPDGGPSPLTYAWSQVSGTTVSIQAANTCSAIFQAPAVDAALEFQLTVGDGLTSAVDTVSVVVDSQPPVLSPQSLLPYPNQGLDALAGAPARTCFRAKVSDNVGLDLSEESLQQAMRAFSVQTVSGKETFVPIAGKVTAIEEQSGAAWLLFTPDFENTYTSGLLFGLKISVTINAGDIAGNFSAPYTYTFTIEDSPPALPAQQYSTDPNPDEFGDILSVTLQEGRFIGARMEFLDTLPVFPYFAFVTAPSKVKPTQNLIYLNVQPAMVFQDPVRLYVPMNGVNNLRKVKVFHYDANPAVGWQEAKVGDGWLLYREDHLKNDPPLVELWITHF